MSLQSGDLKYLQMLLRFAALTYPMRTLKRRIGLLSWDEKVCINNILGEIESKIERIDAIISKAAEDANDKWP